MPLDLAIRVPAFGVRAQDYGGAWMIEPRAARSLAAMASRADWPAHAANAEPPAGAFARQAETVAAASGGKPTQVAVVRLTGLLMKQTTSGTEGTSTVLAKRDLRQAAANPDVAAVVLVIDSPGGTAAGTEELAREVRATAARKPVVAFVEDLCASAAYYVASQADQVFASSAQALVGSIGTVLAMYDLSAAAKAQGVEALVFATGPHKGTGIEGAAVTDEQRAEMQSVVDSLQRGFDAAVKSGRGLSAKQLAAVRTGQVWPADAAMGLGLIDGLKSFEQVVAIAAAAAGQRVAGKPAGGKMVTFQAWLTAKGYDPSAVAGDHAAALQLVYDAEQGMGTPPVGRVTQMPNGTAVGATADAVRAQAPDAVAAQRAKAAAEYERTEAIQSVGKKYSAAPSKVADAIRVGMAANEFELSVMREAYAGNGIGTFAPGAGQSAARATLNAEVVVAALCQTGSLPNVGKAFSAEVNQRAHEQYRGGLGLQEVLLLCAAENGYRGRQSISMGNLKEVLQYAFPVGGPMQSGFSTFGTPGIVSNTANKFLLEGFMSGPEDWRMLSRVASVKDFKTITSYRMTGLNTFEQVGPDGELKHGQLSELSYTNKANTYGRLHAITRQDIINDDLGALTRVPMELGRGGVDKLNQVFWAAFLDNSSFFSSTAVTTPGSAFASNLSASSPLGGAGLTAVKTLFYKQVKPDGTPINVMPKFLVVPPELIDQATTLLRDREIRDNTANAKYTTGNPHAGMPVQIVTSPYLSNATYTGYSATSWYLLADPAALAMIETVFLNGQQTPTIEQSDAEFDTLGIQMRGYFDFGVTKQEPRAAVKATA